MTSFSSHCSTVEIPTSFCLALNLHPLWMHLFSGFLRLPEALVKEPNSFGFALLEDFEILCLILGKLELMLPFGDSVHSSWGKASLIA